MTGELVDDAVWDTAVDGEAAVLRCSLCGGDAVEGDTRCERHVGRYSERRQRRLNAAVKRYVGASPASGRLDVSEGSRAAGSGTVGGLGLTVPREVDPAVALLEEVHLTAGNVKALREKISDMEESELVWGKVMETVVHRGEGTDGEDEAGEAVTITESWVETRRTEHRAVISAWWELYERERKHLAGVSVAALKAGVEERRVRIAERSLDALEEVFERALVRLGHDPRDQLVRSVIGEELQKAIGSGLLSTMSSPGASVVDGDTNMPFTVDVPEIGS